MGGGAEAPERGAMTARFADWLFRHSGAGWAALAILTAVAVAGLARVEYNDDFKRSFRPEEDFGSLAVADDGFVCVVRGSGLFDAAAVPRWIEFDEELRKVPGIRKVASLLGGGSPGKGGAFGPPGAALPPAVFRAEGGEGAGGGSHRAADLFLDGSRGTMLFVAEPDPGLRLVRELLPVRREIEKLLADLRRRTGFETEIAGMPALRIHLVETTRREQIVFSVGSCLLGGILALAVFRRLAALAVIFPVPAVAGAWAVGGMGIAGEPVNLLNTTVAVLIPVISLTDAIHLTYAIRRHLVAGKDPRRAARDGLAEVGFACFMTSLTTATAFASLAFSSNPAVARFGTCCAAGTMAAFLAVVLLTPLAAAAFPARFLLPRNPARDASSRLDGLAAFVSRRSRAIAAAAGAVAVAGAAACLGLEYDFRYSENLDPGSEAKRAIERLDAAFGGSQPLAVVVSWDGRGPVEERRLLEVLEAVHGAVERPGRTGGAFSVWSLWREADEARPGAKLGDLAEFFPGLSLEGLLDREFGAALVKVPVRDLGAKLLAPFLEEIERRFDSIERGHPGFRVRCVGLTAALVRKSGPMLRELTTSLFFAGFAIFVLIGLSARSWGLGAAGILPNALPLVVAGAWLRLLGEEVRFIDVICFSICLGIAVDDTIHVLFRFRENRMRGLATAAAVEETVRTVGRALVATTVILLGGFALLLTSEIATIRHFGRMGILILAVALAADLLALPALLLLARRKVSRGP